MSEQASVVHVSELTKIFKVPEREKGEVLAAFASHKGEVTEGSMAGSRA